MKRKLISLLLAVGLVASLAPSVAAYNIPGGYWDSLELADNELEVCFLGGSGTGTFDNRSHIVSAMNIWSTATDITFVDTTEPSGDLCLVTDVTVQLTNIGAGCNPWANTDDIDNNEGGIVFLRFNSTCTWYWGTGTTPGGEVDSATVAGHEAGHVLGLGHVDEVNVASDAGYPQVWYEFDNLCSGTYKWDKYCVRPTSPKNTFGKIYSGGLDPGVGNYSTSPHATLPAGDYTIQYEFANESLTRNPSGVKLQLYQGTTLKWTSGFTSGLSVMSGEVTLTWTTSAVFRFSVPYSKSAIYSIRVFSFREDYKQLMESVGPQCGTDQPSVLSADDADGIHNLYPSLAISGSWPNDLSCS